MQQTFPGLLMAHAGQRPDAPAMREKAFGIWQTLSWSKLATMVTDIAGAMHEAGLRRGDRCGPHARGR
ncbi:MAG: hypothetical protein R3317_09785, partial [Burkholderiaceae bacterium]|nr:hypothetical protein [Burkholderiaceae bacterium]